VKKKGRGKKDGNRTPSVTGERNRWPRLLNRARKDRRKKGRERRTTQVKYGKRERKQ